MHAHRNERVKFVTSHRNINPRRIFFPGVVVPPSAPIGPINVKNISPTSMMVTWKPPCDDGGGAVEAYIIEIREILEADVSATPLSWK